MTRNTDTFFTDDDRARTDAGGGPRVDPVSEPLPAATVGNVRNMLRPRRYIGREIDVEFDEAPALKKTPHCPDVLHVGDETLRVVELLEEWSDFTRRGRLAKNMREEHLEVARSRGSWGVGRMFFRVRVEDGRLFELYYDRAPKDATDRLGSWFLRCELARD